MVTVFAASSAQQINLRPVNTDIYIYQEYRNTETAFSGPMLLLVTYKQVLPYKFYHAITTIYSEHFTTRF